MNKKTKSRMVVAGGIIVVVIVLLLAFLGGGTSAKVTTVADAAAGKAGDGKIQVSGKVVDNSYSVTGDGVLVFSIRDDDAAAAVLPVSYDKGVSATFGNGVTAICTGRMNSAGTLECSELVTQCPSKYESATDALGVSQLLDYGASMVGKTTKLAGVVQAGTLADATKAVRFVLVDEAAGESGTAGVAGAALPIVFEGALPDAVQEGESVVVMGALDESGAFLATDVALKG